MNDNLAAANELKQEGNTQYSEKNYERAKQLYTQAIGTVCSLKLELHPNEFSFYGNRSACSLFLEKFASLFTLGTRTASEIAKAPSLSIQGTRRGTEGSECAT